VSDGSDGRVSSDTVSDASSDGTCAWCACVAESVVGGAHSTWGQALQRTTYSVVHI